MGIIDKKNQHDFKTKKTANGRNRRSLWKG